ncbi:lipoprotein-releasing ABC transporter permease subunit LolC [Candidatus Erwinia haradaeae]|uniref:Lipoprotein-releasing system transmembrane protein LolC n=1 Tax=Candidatus Erwinia haradaeae TaxID=1922217 RepID=A0A451DAF3_9GAMM|nr:lipoprotein-releasing ABC transporter permease subunit LolC [Candidatus Erwinia haradaeae]VFP83298.1 Lipoprotein-releasing system transmembrane protein LolC [Candidatus Erwinia haradaeae]
MYRSLILFISLRYMQGLGSRSHGFGYFISWLSVMGLAIGVMVLVIVLSVMNGLEQQLEEKSLGFIPHVLITSKTGSIDPNKLPESLFHLKGVNYIQSLATSEVVLQSTTGMAVGLLLGINTNDDNSLVSYFVQDQKKKLKAGEYNVIIGAQLADHLHLKPHSTVRLLVPTSSFWTPLGRMPSQRVFNVIDTFSTDSDVDSCQVLVNQQDASRLMRYPRGHITGWRLWLEKPLEVSSINKKILPNWLAWHDWRESKGALFQAVKIEKNIMGLLISLIIMIAFFNIVTSLCLLIMDKKGEVAILKTQGLRHGQIMLMFMLQGTLVGVVGSIFGVCLGILLSGHIGVLMIKVGLCNEGVVFPVVISISQVMLIAVIATIVAFISVLYPSYYAATRQPAEALRYE